MALRVWFVKVADGLLVYPALYFENYIAADAKSTLFTKYEFVLLPFNKLVFEY